MEVSVRSRQTKQAALTKEVLEDVKLGQVPFFVFSAQVCAS